MKFIRLSLACLVVSLLSSVGWAKKYDGLKVLGNYKNLKIVIEDVPKNAWITKDDLERTTKMRLLANGIKPTTAITSHYLYVEFNVLKGGAHSADVALTKYSNDYGVSEKVAGFSFEPEQGAYGSVGTGSSKTYLLESLTIVLDKFILDYLESNIE